MLEPTQGRMLAKLGDFGGIDRNGAPVGFLGSNSLVVHGDDVLVTNLSLNVQTALSQPADELGWRIVCPGICAPSMDRGFAR